MAPLDQYLMDPNAEIPWCEARLRHPLPSRPRLWASGGMATKLRSKGTNGFVCNLDRPWMDQFGNSPEFSNSKTRGPVCYDRQAARTLRPITLIKTRLALAGKSKAEMNEAMKAATEKGELPAPEPGGMAYMLSKQGFLNSRCGNCAPIALKSDFIARIQVMSMRKRSVES